MAVLPTTASSLLFWLFATATASFVPSPTAQPFAAAARPFAAHRQPPPSLCSSPDEDGDSEESEEAAAYGDEDVDVAWQQFRSASSAEGWWQKLRREARLSVRSPRERLEEAGGILVSVAVFFVILKAYVLQAGGGIVIVPVPDGAGLQVYNFNELKVRRLASHGFEPLALRAPHS